MYPGSIEEIDLTIMLKDQILSLLDGEHPLMLRVIARCGQPEFDEL